MKNSHSPILAPSSPSALTPSSKSIKTLNTCSGHQLQQAQVILDGLLNYLSCSNDNIIQIANQLERNCSTAGLLVETLTSQKPLRDDRSQNKDFSKLLIKEKSPLGKRPNPFLGVLPYESLAQESLEDSETESTLNESEEDLENDSLGSEGSEGYDADFDTPEDTAPRSSQDQQAQTSPIIPIENSFPRAPQYFLCFSLPENPIKDESPSDDNELKPQQKQEGISFNRSLIFGQQVFLMQPLPIITSLVNEVEESES